MEDLRMKVVKVAVLVGALLVAVQGVWSGDTTKTPAPKVLPGLEGMKPIGLSSPAATKEPVKLWIGEIGLTEQQAIEYMEDCVYYPDTLLNVFDTRPCTRPTEPEELVDMMARLVEERRLEDAAWDMIYRWRGCRTGYVVPRTPTGADYARYIARQERLKNKFENQRRTR